MDDTKAWYKSKGMWGSIVTIAIGAFVLYSGLSAGQSFTEAATAAAEAVADETSISNLTATITGAIGTFGGLLSLAGRVFARTKVGLN